MSAPNQSSCDRCRDREADVEFPDGRATCFDCMGPVELLEVVEDSYRGRYGLIGTRP